MLLGCLFDRRRFLLLVCASAFVVLVLRLLSSLHICGVLFLALVFFACLWLPAWLCVRVGVRILYGGVA